MNSGARGRVTIRFVLHPTGPVAHATVTETTLKVKRIEECLRKRILRIKFPQFEGEPFPAQVVLDIGSISK
jgi:hypothetical protein